jgi:hypothetical protein
MLRLILCGLLATAFGSAARAGELDRETGPAAPATVKSEAAPAVAGSELDGESPAQSHYWRGGWRGPGYGWGWGYSPFRVSIGWGGWGGWGWGGYYPAYSSWGWGGYYPGFYGYRSFGFGYRPFFSAYYPIGWGWGW